MTKKKEVQAQEENLPVAGNMDFRRDSGKGFENADADAFAIPYLVLLQTNSPQVDKDEGQYVEGAEAGQIMNTVTNELFDELTIVAVDYSRRMVEWVPRDAGGGFRGSYDPSDPEVCNLERNDQGRYELENGNFINDTRYHFVLIDKGDGSTEPALIALTSTQIRKSRNWMTSMNNIKFKDDQGIYTPPSFSHKFAVETVSESNDKGKWKGWKFTLIGPLESPGDAHIYDAALLFIEQIKKGAAEVTAPPVASDDDAKSDVPF